MSLPLFPIRGKKLTRKYFSMLFSSGITVLYVLTSQRLISLADLSLTVWVFHMFVHGFGNYTVFVQYQWVSWWFFFEGVIRVPVQVGPLFSC
jgi:hypothetical protein